MMACQDLHAVSISSSRKPLQEQTFWKEIAFLSIVLARSCRVTNHASRFKIATAERLAYVNRYFCNSNNVAGLLSLLLSVSSLGYSDVCHGFATRLPHITPRSYWCWKMYERPLSDRVHACTQLALKPFILSSISGFAEVVLLLRIAKHLLGRAELVHLHSVGATSEVVVSFIAFF